MAVAPFGVLLSAATRAQKSHLKGWLIMLKVFLLLPIDSTRVLG